MRTLLTRYRFWLLGLAIVVACLFVFMSRGASDPKPTWNAFGRLRTGMSEREVIEILGAPPGNRARGITMFCTSRTHEEAEAFTKAAVTREWVNDHALIELAFDATGRLTHKFISSNMGR
jgi:hypothetical protein